MHPERVTRGSSILVAPPKKRIRSDWIRSEEIGSGWEGRLLVTGRRRGAVGRTDPETLMVPMIRSVMHCHAVSRALPANRGGPHRPNGSPREHVFRPVDAQVHVGHADGGRDVGACSMASRPLSRTALNPSTATQSPPVIAAAVSNIKTSSWTSSRFKVCSNGTGRK